MPRKGAAKPEDGVRERLIEAGLCLFAAHGLEGVRTRTLAERAGVNQQAIPYHFGGKDGVYAAVIGAIADEMVASLTAAGLLPEDIGPDVTHDEEDCSERLRKLLKGFAFGVLSPGRPRERTILIVREQLSPTSNFDILFRRFIEPLHLAICHAVGGLRGCPPDEKIVIIQAHALVGQVLAFVVAQEAFLRRVGLTRLDSGEVEQIADIVATMAITIFSVNASPKAAMET